VEFFQVFHTLRDFLAHLEKHGELTHSRAAVKTCLEVNRIAKASIEKNGPAIFFDNVEGYDIPIVAGVFGTRERIFRALGTSREAFSQEFNRRAEQIEEFPPRQVKSGAIKERVHTGDSIDLDILPLTTHGELDGGFYITSGVCVSKDPTTLVRNASFHRLKKHGENRVGLWMARSDLRKIVDSYWAQKKPCPVAIVIGADPYTVLAACTSIPCQQDELALAGALKGDSIELVACESVPLEVPAEAEIVLEGWVHPGDELEEGPFAETSGYYSSLRMAPVIRLTAMTHREDPIFQDIVTGIPPDENQAMLITHEAGANKLATDMFSETVVDVHLTPGGCTSFNAVVRVRRKSAGEAKQIGMHLLTVMPRLRNVWVVDEKIDSHNPIQVEWAYATRCRGERDMTIVKGMRSVALDPCAVNGIVDKVVFDCTSPLPEEMIPGEVEHIPCE
jgi:2,5-furandicarboxylate decarboxylase 1